MYFDSSVKLGIISKFSVKSGIAVRRIIVFPARSIFDEIEPCPHSLHASDAIFETMLIPRQRKRISYFSFSIPEIKMISLRVSLISLKDITE